MGVKFKLLAAMAGALILSPGALAAEIAVGPGGHASIGAAITAAAPGDVLRIAPGTYRERLVLDRPLTLVGEGLPVVDGGGIGDVITIAAPNCVVRGLRVTGSGTETLDDTAALKILAERATVEGCHVDGSLFGFYVSEAGHHRLVANRITGLASKSREDRGDAIRLHASSDNVITDNVVANTRDGIYFNGAARNVVTGNTITDVRYGLHYMSSDDNVFEHNRFMRTDAGAALMFSRNISLSHNTFTGNRGYRAYGLLVKDCEDSRITENAIADNRTGLFMDGAINNVVANNHIAANDVGIEVRASSEGNRFTGNVIAQNTSEVALPTGNDANDWARNYWGAYQGYDMNGDGIGDVPHRAGDLFSYLTETMPPARLFLLGPAVQALTFAERTFPVIDAPQVTDAVPVMRPESLPGIPPLPQTPPVPGSFGLASGLMLGLGLVPVWLARRTYRP